MRRRRTPDRDIDGMRIGSPYGTGNRVGRGENVGEDACSSSCRIDCVAEDGGRAHCVERAAGRVDERPGTIRAGFGILRENRNGGELMGQRGGLRPVVGGNVHIARTGPPGRCRVAQLDGEGLTLACGHDMVIPAGGGPYCFEQSSGLLEGAGPAEHFLTDQENRHPHFRHRACRYGVNPDKEAVFIHSADARDVEPRRGDCHVSMRTVGGLVVHNGGVSVVATVERIVGVTADEHLTALRGGAPGSKRTALQIAADARFGESEQNLGGFRSDRSSQDGPYRHAAAF